MTLPTEARPGLRYFRTLDAFRGLCAIFVAIGHLRTDGTISYLPIFISIGYWVDFFFVLSGFVIAHTAYDTLRAQPGRSAGFLIRRVGRIWPLHIVVLAGVFAYQCALWVANHQGFVDDPVAFSDRAALDLLPANVLMIQSWGFIPFPTWNIPAWSISAEFAAYLVFALACWLFGGHARPALLILGALCGAVMIATSPRGMANDNDLSVLRCLYGFCTGIGVHWLWSVRQDWRVPAVNVVEPVLFVIAFGLVSLTPSSLSYLIVPLFGMAILVFAQEQGWLSRAMQGRTGRLLGERSYSIYIVHYLVLTGFLSLASVAGKLGFSAIGTTKIGTVTAIDGPAWLMDLTLVIYLAVILGLGALTYRFVEDPARRVAAAWAKKADARLAGNRA